MTRGLILAIVGPIQQILPERVVLHNYMFMSELKCYINFCIPQQSVNDIKHNDTHQNDTHQNDTHQNDTQYDNSQHVYNI